MSDTLRLFVAIELPPHILRLLTAVIEDLRNELHGPFRWVSPDTLHLTLKFLGNVDAQRVDLLTGILRDAVAPPMPFRLALELAGTFPVHGPPRVVWAGIGGETGALLSLQAAVEKALVDAGEAPQEQKFHPHLTLARVRETLHRTAAAELRERLRQLRFDSEAVFDIRQISLVHSTLTPEGPIHRTLAEAPLAGA